MAERLFPQKSPCPEVLMKTLLMVEFIPPATERVLYALPSSTERIVVEALLTTLKACVFVEVSGPHTDSLLYGVVVPMPTLPEESMISRGVVVPVSAPFPAV